MGIEIRPLQEPEIPQAAAVCDYAFRSNPVSVVRNPRVWKWRYWEFPGFDPRGAVAAVDGERVVGTVMVTFRRLRLDRWVRFGVIDDVATLPECRGKGVARRMMEAALRFIESRGAGASLLYADPKGVARNLYLDLGYRDIHLFGAWVRPLWSGLLAHRLASGLRMKPGLRRRVIEPSDGLRLCGAGELEEYRKALEAASGHLAGFPEMEGGFWGWMRARNPTRPRTLALGWPPRAGCSLCPLPVALLAGAETEGLWMGDFFSADGSDPLAGAVSLARRNGFAFVGALSSPLDRTRVALLRRHGFVTGFSGTMMVKPFGDIDLRPFSRRPWHPMAESGIGLP
ncbi:MAG: GNAT family N-acetyltransferase [Halobacteria archaeon]